MEDALVAEYRGHADRFLADAQKAEGPRREQLLMLVAAWDQLVRERIKFLEYCAQFEAAGAP
jgi:hypothetical protein